MLFLCVFSLRSLSWAGPSSPSEDIPQAGLRKTAVSDKRHHKHKVHNISRIYRDTAVLQVSSFVKRTRKKNKKTPSQNKEKNPNPNGQTEATTKELPGLKKPTTKKKTWKKGKKLKLRHGCIAPKTTGNRSTGGTGCG